MLFQPRARRRATLAGRLRPQPGTLLPRVVPGPVLNHRTLTYMYIPTIRVHSEVAVLVFVGAPFTLASYVVEGGSSKNFTKIKRLAFSQPKEYVV
ncbi:unnamed protein product [Cuscuta europaea]|uniref:Uroporphyrinogen decarboxylase (URO-D) domain-containing protein n=1 Tax=Cuscuta europaea TaxID=41803 RepID=A0A9P1EDX9_CUSEU|nr:unnamed protein product [Cuscuta europaea]